jgi:hypothetical protein
MLVSFEAFLDSLNPEITKEKMAVLLHSINFKEANEASFISSIHDLMS